MNEASALAVNCHTSLCVLSHPKGERKKATGNPSRHVDGTVSYIPGVICVCAYWSWYWFYFLERKMYCISAVECVVLR